MGQVKNAPGRVVVSVEMEGKNRHKFTSGLELMLIRNVDNFNRRYTEPVNATVISSDIVPRGTQVLLHHNSTQEMYRLYNLGNLSGKEIGMGIKYFAVPEAECFAYFDGNDWLPCQGFEFGLR